MRQSHRVRQADGTLIRASRCQIAMTYLEAIRSRADPALSQGPYLMLCEALHQLSGLDTAELHMYK